MNPTSARTRLWAFIQNDILHTTVHTEHRDMRQAVTGHSSVDQETRSDERHFTLITFRTCIKDTTLYFKYFLEKGGIGTTLHVTESSLCCQCCKSDESLVIKT